MSESHNNNNVLTETSRNGSSLYCSHLLAGCWRRTRRCHLRLCTDLYIVLYILFRLPPAGAHPEAAHAQKPNCSDSAAEIKSIKGVRLKLQFTLHNKIGADVSLHILSIPYKWNIYCCTSGSRLFQSFYRMLAWCLNQHHEAGLLGSQRLILQLELPRRLHVLFSLQAAALRADTAIYYLWDSGQYMVVCSWVCSVQQRVYVVVQTLQERLHVCRVCVC